MIGVEFNAFILCDMMQLPSIAFMYNLSCSMHSESLIDVTTSLELVGDVEHVVERGSRFLPFITTLCILLMHASMFQSNLSVSFHSQNNIFVLLLF